MIERFLKQQGIIAIATGMAIIFIITSLVSFIYHVNMGIKMEMRSRVEAICGNYVQFLQNEVDYLKKITETAADLIGQAQYQSDEAIMEELYAFAQACNFVNTLFMTSTGQMYTSLLEDIEPEQEKSIKDLPVSKIDTTLVLPPYYLPQYFQAVFDIATPVTMGGKEGVLVSTYSIERFREIFESDFLEGNTHVGIVDKQGKVIMGDSYNTDASTFGINIFDEYEKANVAFSFGSSEKMRQDFLEGKEDFVIYSTSGVERYCAYAPTEVRNWYIVVMAPENVLRTQSLPIQKQGVWLTVELVAIMSILLIFVSVVRRNEQKSINVELRKAAMIDGLTGIYNRGAVETGIIHFLANAKEDAFHALLTIDIDFFKEINDNHGHIIGDKVLKSFAKRLKETFSAKDLIGRMGGDEFIVLMTNCKDMEEVRAKATDITKPFLVEVGAKHVVVSISVGVAVSPKDGSGFLELYQHADSALYYTKANGKSGFSFY